MAAEPKQVITLSQSNFHYRVNTYPSYPYYSNAPARISYYDFDLLIDNVGLWHFELSTNYAKAQLGIQFFTQHTLDLVANGNVISGQFLDTGWQPLSFDYNVPDTYLGSPVLGFRIAIRQATNNPNIANDFTINSFIARKL